MPLPPRLSYSEVMILERWWVRLVARGLVLGCAIGAGTRAAVDFRRDVWPILETHCVECHGPKKQKSSLRVDSLPALLKGGDVGPAIVPRDATKSHLLERVASTDETERMPLERDPLSPVQIGVLRQWILEGAPWPADAVMTTVAKHWAYEPVVRP